MQPPLESRGLPHCTPFFGDSCVSNRNEHALLSCLFDTRLRTEAFLCFSHRGIQCPLTPFSELKTQILHMHSSGGSGRETRFFFQNAPSDLSGCGTSCSELSSPSTWPASLEAERCVLHWPGSMFPVSVRFSEQREIPVLPPQEPGYQGEKGGGRPFSKRRLLPTAAET